MGLLLRSSKATIRRCKMDVDERLERVEGETGSNQTSNQISDRARFVAHCTRDEIFRLLALHRNVKTGRELLNGTIKPYFPDGNTLTNDEWKAELIKSQQADMDELQAIEATVRARMGGGDISEQE